MIDSVKPFDVHVGARLLDFFGTRSTWNRSLWHVGTCLMLDEVLEASAALRTGVLSDAALSFLVNATIKVVGTDPAVGSAERRRAVQAVLTPKIQPDGLNFHVLS